MKRTSQYLYTTVLCTLVLVCTSHLFSACDRSSSGILSQGKMVDVLYDYHMAQGMANIVANDSLHLIQAYMDAVFTKNGITEAEFDSSMVYYHRHNDQLTEIYSELKDRMTEEEERLARKIGSNEMMVFTQGGDTADIWAGRQLYILRNSDLYNKSTFKIKCDSSFHIHDKFMMEASVAFVRENMDDRDYYIDLCLSLEYKNGKTISQVRHVNNEAKQQLNLTAVDDEEIKSLSVFFYYEGKSSTRNIGLVRDISLYRMHEQEDTTAIDQEKADPVESTIQEAPVAPVPRLQEEVLTPEQKMQQSVSDKAVDRKIEILEAPKVRTPNRDLKRRKSR